MPKYLLAYKGGAMPESPEEQQRVMAAWTSWFGSAGQAVVDPGNPFSASTSVASDGSVSDGGAAQLTGYSVLEAGDLTSATELAKGCPILETGGTVEVYETFEAM